MTQRVLPMAVVETVDILGSGTMILLAVLCLHRAFVLRKRDPQNMIWTYLVWFCTGLLVFSFSRSAAHIVKHALSAAGHGHVWNQIQPVSGSLNSITFVIVGSITLFFSRVYRTYQRMLQDKALIEKAHGEIAQLNVNLERMVEARTKELVRMELQLLQADKLASLGELSAGIAHEINNPIGLVLGYTRLILKETDPAVQYYTDLRVIEKHALNCKRIVENLLRFSRATSTTKSPMNLNDLIREVISVVENKFALEKVQVFHRLADDLPVTMADPDKIRQVFMNILMNARQAIVGAGTIMVSSGWDGETRRIQISFVDTGCGIPPDIMHKIFDPFFTTKPIGTGTGLGLAVSYGIVKDHEGEIRVESGPWKGSTFIVELPILEPEESITVP